MPTILSTPRLDLREIESDDAEFVRELMNEPAWLEFIGDRHIDSVDAARAFIDEHLRPSYSEHGFGFWLVQRRSDAVAVGICGLIQRDTLDDVDIGFAVLERHWGRGYAREAAEAVVDFARDTVGLDRLAAVTAPHNRRSIRLLEALGMSYESMIRLGDRPDPVRFYVRAL